MNENVGCNNKQINFRRHSLEVLSITAYYCLTSEIISQSYNIYDNKVVVHIHNGMLFSYWKEHIWISSNEVDETGAHYTEWSKSERKTPVQYINAYIWNLERWSWWPYTQDNKRNTDVKNRFLDSVREGEGRMIWENSIETHILSYVK